MTIQRRTVLMTAALCLYQGKVKCFFLDSPPCGTELSGINLVTHGISVLRKFGIKLSPDQVTAVAADGEIVRKIESRISALTGIPIKWCTVNWDLSHLLELARKGKEITPFWLKNSPKTGILNVINDFSVKFKWGKDFEEGLKLAEEITTKWYAPSAFSDTRFAQFEHRVISAFVNNWQTTTEYFKRKSVSRTPKTGVFTANALRAKSCLNEINNIKFLTRVLLYQDIADSTSQLSCILQDLKVLPWDKSEVIDHYCAWIDETIQCLSDYNDKKFNESSLSELLPNFQKHASELRDFMFKNQPIQKSNIRQHFIAVLNIESFLNVF